MTAECPEPAVAQLTRVAWRTVGAIVALFVADRDAGADLPAGLRRVGTRTADAVDALVMLTLGADRPDPARAPTRLRLTTHQAENSFHGCGELLGHRSSPRRRDDSPRLLGFHKSACGRGAGKGDACTPMTPWPTHRAWAKGTRVQLRACLRPGSTVTFSQLATFVEPSTVTRLRLGATVLTP